MAEDYNFDGEDLDELKKVLLYRKIVDVSFNEYQGYMILDDGTKLRLVANEGCGGCGNGWYYLTELNKCDNAITDVSIEYDTHNYDEVIKVFVIAEDRRIQIVNVEGDEGNGYYGRGFEVWVEKP